tara:strand:+ start:246 stop:461 length:216 start_codon:yes stop_codon:yes gene_type:complete
MFTTIVAICFMANGSGEPVNPCFIRKTELYFKTYDACSTYAENREDEIKFDAIEENLDTPVVSIACVREQT